MEYEEIHIIFKDPNRVYTTFTYSKMTLRDGWVHIEDGVEDFFFNKENIHRIRTKKYDK